MKCLRRGETLEIWCICMDFICLRISSLAQISAMLACTHPHNVRDMAPIRNMAVWRGTAPSWYRRYGGVRHRWYGGVWPLCTVCRVCRLFTARGTWRLFTISKICRLFTVYRDMAPIHYKQGMSPLHCKQGCIAYSL